VFLARAIVEISLGGHDGIRVDLVIRTSEGSGAAD
jgi:hypothetical protein